MSATETQSFKAANKEIARNNIDAVAKATFEKELAEIDEVKATREELSLAKTELRDSINTKSAQLRSSIDDEVANRKADSAAIRYSICSCRYHEQRSLNSDDQHQRNLFTQ